MRAALTKNNLLSSIMHSDHHLLAAACETGEARAAPLRDSGVVGVGGGGEAPTKKATTHREAKRCKLTVLTGFSFPHCVFDVEGGPQKRVISSTSACRVVRNRKRMSRAACKASAQH
jgi:hypothetical protein